MTADDHPDLDISTRYKLLDLLSDNAIHSGPELASRLGVSRTAIWKHLNELEKLGLRCHAIRGRGYQMPHPFERIDEAIIRAALKPAIPARLAGLDIHPHLDSTNTHLMRIARQQNPCSGLVCLADSQGSGRGRMGRPWVSPPGANIYMSILWQYEDHAYLTGLSLAIGVAVARTLTATGVMNTALKWPNDILWQDKKLGGILIEATGTAHGGCQVVIGLGLNRYIPESLARNIDQAWIDLYRIQGDKMPARNLLIAMLLNEIIPLLAQYPETGLAAYLPEWQSLHGWTDREVILYQGDREIRGRIACVSEQGLLVLRDATGALQAFASGEVRLTSVH